MPMYDTITVTGKTRGYLFPLHGLACKCLGFEKGNKNFIVVDDRLYEQNAHSDELISCVFSGNIYIETKEDGFDVEYCMLFAAGKMLGWDRIVNE